MMVPLVIAQLRRVRWTWLPLLLIGTTAVTSGGEGRRLNTAMIGLFSFGAISALGKFWSREMRVLPIPARQARRAAWLAVMCIPVLVLLIRLVWIGIRHAAGWQDVTASAIEALSLMSLFDLLFMSASFTIVDSFEDERAGGLLHILTSIPVYAIWYFLPFAAPEALPLSLDAWQWFNWLALLVMVGMASRPFFTDLDEWPRLGVDHSALARRATRPDHGPTIPIDTPLALPRDVKIPLYARLIVFLLLGSPRVARGLDDLIGFRRLLPRWATTAAIGASVALLVPQIFSLFSGKPLPPPMTAGLSDGRFLLASGLVFLPLIPPGFTSGLQPWLQQLRRMPMRTGTLVALITVAPWRGVAIFWCFACLVHMASTFSAPETLRLDMLVAMLGLASLTGALMSRFRAEGVSSFVVMFPMLVGLCVLWVFDESAVATWRPEYLPVGGALALLAAIAMNYNTFTHATSSALTYREDLGR